MKKSILILILLFVIVLNGCSSKVDTTLDLTQKNKVLQEQLKVVNDKIAKDELAYDVRNKTDLVFHQFGALMVKGDLESVKPLVTSSMIKKGTLTMLKEELTFEGAYKNNGFRQRWYELVDGYSMRTGYEYLNVKYGDSMKVLTINFKLENGTWKIDSIAFDA
ncbi:hypothetical protein G9F71_000880 [Clostridium sp. FP2]|uniref:hypothetical protein n=1 Tax=Clostridium sp. FP2 TaxID=2724481 RepID=UPI0013E927FA|nr:hypothetical protein [Clostridium sp. FP2]MBZ9621446.1 hypothetical protein [Clostridium sp. FP2]